MRKTLRASILMLALCAPAFAGDIPCPPGPQPQGVTAEQPAEEPTADGDIPNPPLAEELAAQIMMTLIGSVLALF